MIQNSFRTIENFYYFFALDLYAQLISLPNLRNIFDHKISLHPFFKSKFIQNFVLFLFLKRRKFDFRELTFS